MISDFYNHKCWDYLWSLVLIYHLITAWLSIKQACWSQFMHLSYKEDWKSSRWKHRSFLTSVPFTKRLISNYLQTRQHCKSSRNLGMRLKNCPGQERLSRTALQGEEGGPTQWLHCPASRLAHCYTEFSPSLQFLQWGKAEAKVDTQLPNSWRILLRRPT